MPLHDDLPRRRDADRGRIFDDRNRARLFLARTWWSRHRKGGGDDRGGEAVPVEPNRPNTLNGGAAATLEFDD